MDVICLGRLGKIIELFLGDFPVIFDTGGYSYHVLHAVSLLSVAYGTSCVLPQQRHAPCRHIRWVSPADVPAEDAAGS